MKTACVILSLMGATIAQSVAILSPPAGATLSPGDTFVVDIDKADSLSPSQDVSVAIGLAACESPESCDAVASGGLLGDPLFTGDYSPQLRPNSTHLFQNYTVQIPSTLPSGQFVLAVAHFYLLGAGATPTVEMVNSTVTIA
ncbi:hypothetical protein C2E23DRAFT_872437 [Lenzites betulinus]|nr:hypothetical protein C2E23DRAFT_872437 [Lenzites betulinus]